jgi:hypothetical protein
MMIFIYNNNYMNMSPIFGLQRAAEERKDGVIKDDVFILGK